MIQPFTISHCTDCKLSRTSKVGEREEENFPLSGKRVEGEREKDRERQRERERIGDLVVGYDC